MSASLVRATVRAVSKRKLQPTRAALTLTPSAVNKIKQLLKDKPEHVGLKVGVRTRGCNGLSYTLEYTKTKGDSDEEVVQDDYCVGKRGQTGNRALNPLKEMLRQILEPPVWLS
ncbi:iron-sulfur cluster assembly 1 homolog, mitochondrial isoform X2 [Diceros bicornis minor]|uniref:iron-sulfur cluster assembly 1 homolog, mitochondrial isoform X2 n=1 Tax=Diceros bicornis minor TaxID=77932 RepID=UPI0026EB5BF2|nr:iron-sulfur cluster assembly 1 homolog, mitochondrial isoform X2 [Diceros bicornis minor]